MLPGDHACKEGPKFYKNLSRSASDTETLGDHTLLPVGFRLGRIRSGALRAHNHEGQPEILLHPLSPGTLAYPVSPDMLGGEAGSSSGSLIAPPRESAGTVSPCQRLPSVGLGSSVRSQASTLPSDSASVQPSEATPSFSVISQFDGADDILDFMERACKKPSHWLALIF